jgi:hypothetical protein
MSSDGSSLQTLYKCSQNPLRKETFSKTSIELPTEIQGYLLLVRDLDGAIFGCLFRNCLVVNGGASTSSGSGGGGISRSSSGSIINKNNSGGNNQSYYGSHEISVFRYVDGILEYFPNTAKNNYHILCTNTYVSFGGGVTGPAISLVQDCLHGSSEPCVTFDSPRMSKNDRFSLSECELYALRL